MEDNSWKNKFREIYDAGHNRYLKGSKSAAKMFDPAEVEWLKTIGCTAQELFDFVDDAIRYGEPSFETALALAELRREYFLTVLKGQWSGRETPNHQLPSKSSSLQGVPWLPRLIEKAKAKLKGEMNPDLMYCCGGDRAFFSEWELDPAGFLKFAWDCDFDEGKILAYVKSGGKAV